jgi:hypothetical protein
METGIGQSRRRIVLGTADECWQRAGIREIVLATVVLMAVLVSDVGNGQNRLSIQRVLYANAVLVARGPTCEGLRLSGHCIKSFGSWPFLRPDNSCLHPLMAFLLHLHRPVLATDLTRCSTLSAPCRSRIAPRSTLCARVGHGSLRAQHSKLSHRLRIAPYSTLGVPHRSRIAPRSILPALYRSRIAPCSALTLREGLRIAPYADTLRPRVGHGLLRAQHFKLRTGHRLLCARHLMLRSDRGYLRSLRSTPCVDRGCLRAQHLEFCAGPGLLPARHLSLRTVHRLLCIRRLALICFLRIAPHSSLSALCWSRIAPCSTLMLRAGTF